MSLSSIPPSTLVCILVPLQVIYLIYTCVLRPYKTNKSNIIEIINEMLFLILLSSLIYLNSKNTWTTTMISLYNWIIVSNSLIVFAVVLVDGFRMLVLKFKKCLNSSPVNQNLNQANVSRIVPKGNDRSIVVGSNAESNNQILDPEIHIPPSFYHQGEIRYYEYDSHSSKYENFERRPNNHN